MQKLGQHFLVNPAIQKKIARVLEAEKNATIIEIGPGHGELTQAILETQANHIILIEKDPTLVTHLKERFKTEERITVREGDVRTILPTLSKELAKAKISYFLVGNLPYYITGYFLRILGEVAHKPKRAVFMLQKEVALRMAAHSPEMNRLAASVQYWGEVSILGVVGKKEFSPPPKVDSALIGIIPKKTSSKKAKQYYDFVRILFAQPRKTILNNLCFGLNAKKKDVLEALHELALDPSLRPQDLSIETIEHIAQKLG
jgi:16S rRNA (adenine1518-N6/adenine1519-N6)-dimethyltransferase